MKSLSRLKNKYFAISGFFYLITYLSLMKIIITEDQKNNLFKPRNLESRYIKWNSEQPEITIDGQTYKVNQYDSEVKKQGVWVNEKTNIKELEQDYIKTKSFFKNIFNNLEIVNEDGYTNYMIGDEIMFQDPKNRYIYVNYNEILRVLSDQYSLGHWQIKGLIQIWMEITYKLGSLTPINYFFLTQV